jgi:hypothetical protein
VQVDSRTAPASAVVDTITDELGARVSAVPADARVTLTGWAVDAGGAAFEGIEVEIGGGRGTGAFTLERPDVAEIFGSPPIVGFRVEVALAGDVLGHRRVALTGVRANGERVPVPVAAALDLLAPLHAMVPGVREGALQGALDEVRAEGYAGTPEEPAVVAVDEAVIVRGWAASTANVPAAFAYAELDGGQLLVRGMAGHARPDVAVALGTAHDDYGFRIRIPVRALGPGHHTLRVLAVAEGVMSPIGAPARLRVDARRSASVHPRGTRLRGKIDLVGRMASESALREERTHLRLGAGEVAVVTGWSGDPVRGALPERLVLAVDGVAHGTVQRGIERADVVTSTDCPGLVRSGFSAVVRADRLSTGFHRAELIAFFADGPAVIDAFSFDVTG